MPPPPKPPYTVAVILFDRVDLLDYAAPVGILSDITHKPTPSQNQPAFEILTLAAEPRPYLAGASRTPITPSQTFTDTYPDLHKIDILVIPGGPPGVINRMATGSGPEKRFIEAFTTQPRPGSLTTEANEERIALSICDGSLFLAAVGALSGLAATSHHTTLEELRGLDPSIEVVDSTARGGERRYVDGGVNGAGVRLVTAGGVTCGLDAALYVVEVRVGREEAEGWARMNEYEWRRVGGESA